MVEETDVDRSRRRGEDLEGLRMLFGCEGAEACLAKVGEGVLEPGVTVEDEFEGDEEYAVDVGESEPEREWLRISAGGESGEETRTEVDEVEV